MSFSPLFYIDHLADGMSITGGFSPEELDELENEAEYLVEKGA